MFFVAPDSGNKVTKEIIRRKKRVRDMKIRKK
jgi:hypothetical protein